MPDEVQLSPMSKLPVCSVLTGIGSGKASWFTLTFRPMAFIWFAISAAVASQSVHPASTFRLYVFVSASAVAGFFLAVAMSLRAWLTLPVLGMLFTIFGSPHVFTNWGCRNAAFEGGSYPYSPCTYSCWR